MKIKFWFPLLGLLLALLLSACAPMPQYGGGYQPDNVQHYTLAPPMASPKCEHFVLVEGGPYGRSTFGHLAQSMGQRAEIAPALVGVEPWKHYLARSGPNVCVIAHSAGSFFPAQALSGNHLVNAVIFIGPAGDWAPLHQATMGELVGAIKRTLGEQATNQLLADYMSEDTGRVKKAMATVYTRIHGIPTTPADLPLVNAGRVHTFDNIVGTLVRKPHLTMPVLIIRGQYDPLRTAAVDMAARHQAPLVVIGGAGHIPQMTNTHQVLGVIMQFLRNNDL